MPSEKKEKKEAFIDSLSSDNIACFRRSASKTKCTVNGAIATAERKKSEAWVELGESVLHSIAAIISTMSLRFTK